MGAERASSARRVDGWVGGWIDGADRREAGQGHSGLGEMGWDVCPVRCGIEAGSGVAGGRKGRGAQSDRQTS